MKHILCALMVIASPVLWAQSLTADAVVYAENGEKFHLYLNGELMNEDPKTNIKLKGLTSEFYQARIDFVDATLPDFTNNNFAVKYGIEVTYRVKLVKNGYALRYFSERPLEAQYKMDSETVIYHEGGNVEPEPAEEPTTQGNVNINMNVNEQGVNTNINGGTTQKTTTTVTTTTNGKPKPKTETVGINMNVDGVNMGINMTIPTDGLDIEESHTTTTTTTTTSGGYQQTQTRPEPKPQSQPQAQPSVQGNCGVAMSSSNFNQAKSSISSKSFSDSKMTTAKQITQTNCLTAQQIKELTMLFDFETDRVTYASFAHKRCVDPQNYFIVNDAFEFESSIEELNQNISK